MAKFDAINKSTQMRHNLRQEILIINEAAYYLGMSAWKLKNIASDSMNATLDCREQRIYLKWI